MFYFPLFPSCSCYICLLPGVEQVEYVTFVKAEPDPRGPRSGGESYTRSLRQNVLHEANMNQATELRFGSAKEFELLWWSSRVNVFPHNGSH